ncbi:hypothetical protein B0H19DRAFT_1238557, partial [Mycena capillaripes]
MESTRRDPGMQALRDRLAELDAQIPSLEAERRKILRKLRTLKFPVLTLPAEVTTEIFIQCVPPEEADFRGGDFDIERDRMVPRLTNAPLLLLQICQVWRNVALATPRLWSTIQVTNDLFIRGAMPSPSINARRSLAYAMLEKWTNRAGVT